MSYREFLNGDKSRLKVCVFDVAALLRGGSFEICEIDRDRSETPDSGYESLLSQIIAVKSTGTSVIVRVPQDDLTATKKVLEMGPDGIVFPMARSAEEADRLLPYTLYPPYGRRGFGPMNAVGYGAMDTLDFVANNHKTMCRFVQVKHIDAVKNLDEIMKNEYIDGYIIGANDLSGSIGELCNTRGEHTVALIKEAIVKQGKMDRKNRNNRFGLDQK